MKETWVQSLGQEDPLEKKMETDSSILAWKSYGQRSLADYSPWGRKESDTATQTHTHSPWGRKRVRHCYTHTHTNTVSCFIVKISNPLCMLSGVRV